MGLVDINKDPDDLRKNFDGRSKTYEGLVFNGYVTCKFCRSAMKGEFKDTKPISHYERFRCTNKKCGWTYEVYADFVTMTLHEQWIHHSMLNITGQMRYESDDGKTIEEH